MPEYVEAFIEAADGGAVTDYPDVLRSALGESWRTASDADVEAAVSRALSGMSPEEIEGFWDTVRSLARTVGQAAQQAAPTVLPLAGAALGTYFGGPVGMSFGTQLGQLGARLVGGPSAPPAAPAPTSPAAPRPQGAPLPSGASSPANQLMALVQNPAFLQSLLGRALGGAGSQPVAAGAGASAGGTEIPFAAMMNALASLARAAGSGSREGFDDEGAAEYLRDAEGELTCDPTDADARAQRVLELLRTGRVAASTEPELDAVTEWMVAAKLLRRG